MAALVDLIELTIARPVSFDVIAMADAVRGRCPDSCAVLAYGSVLRGDAVTDTLVDFYVLTHGFAGVSANPLSRAACRLVPPNVYYAELMRDGRLLRAKYAVMPLKQFESRMGRAVSNSYFWARFSQPTALVWCPGSTIRARVVAALADAATTMHAHAAGDWARGFGETYRTELRSEGPARAGELVARNADYFAAASALLRDNLSITANWPARRAHGKALSVLRLFKAAFTFQGGADYAAWKIARHSGVKIEVTDWQRRHPLLAGLMLLPKLLRKGALR